MKKQTFRLQNMHCQPPITRTKSNIKKYCTNNFGCCDQSDTTAVVGINGHWHTASRTPQTKPVIQMEKPLVIAVCPKVWGGIIVLMSHALIFTTSVRGDITTLLEKKSGISERLLHKRKKPHTFN